MRPLVYQKLRRTLSRLIATPHKVRIVRGPKSRCTASKAGLTSSPALKDGDSYRVKTQLSLITSVGSCFYEAA